MKTIKYLYTLLAVMLQTALPATAQNSDDNKNKAIIETNDGNKVLNTDDIQVIRFDGGKVTVVHSEGETTFDRTLRSLSFQRPNPGTLRLTATTSIGAKGCGNRVQAIDGAGYLKATWAEGDQVYVYTDNDPDNASPIGTLYPKSADWGNSTATLTGNINADGLSNGQTLYFSTKPRPYNFSIQDGTVGSLFYCTAKGTLTIVGANATISDLDFERPFAVVKFTLMDKGNGDAAINAKSLVVNANGNTYTVTPTAAKNELFVGIPAIDTETVTLTATDGNEYYLYQRAGVTFAKNEYYTVNVKMRESDLARPLTFEAKAAGAVVSFSSLMDTSPTIEFSKNGGAWTAYTEPITLTNVGDKVSFRGTNETYAQSTDKDSQFSCTKQCYVYGNIMSLIDEDNFATNTTLTKPYAFAGLFNGNTNIYNHADKALALPATTLTIDCYFSMFYGCTHLTTAPALPATTLAEACYVYMFYNTGLTSAPELPATTLADFCYQSMFYGCESLTASPILPATTLVEGCYNFMFSNCSSLNSVTCLATNISADNCTYYWLYGVPSSGTFNKAASADWSGKTDGYGIPSGWMVINEGVLPGQFTVNTSGGKVSFSMGNLQAANIKANSTSGWKWTFAGHQYDYVGDAVANTAVNGNGTISTGGTIDLFGWSTSATYYGIHNSKDVSTYSGDFVDWGGNAISNGGNTADLWRTLSNDEWGYLFNTRTTTSGVRYAKARVNGVTGIILLPDDWSTSYYALNNTNTADAAFTSNIITLYDWVNSFEPHGAVFLPAAGYREGTNVQNVNAGGGYWSSDYSSSDGAYCVSFHSGAVDTKYDSSRFYGGLVRLVKKQ